MRDFQHQFSIELPKRVRVGIATGIVYALRPPHALIMFTEPCDYVGYCINLAVRLQNHTSDLGFLVHGDLHPELQGMDLYEAVKMKGSQTEPVALFRDDVNRVSPAEFNRKFRSRN
jgi:class 3 adenylate cyclase